MVASWANGAITLGPETGGENYISYQDNSPLTVNGIGILPTGDYSEIRMPHTFGKLIIKSTKNIYNTDKS